MFEGRQRRHDAGSLHGRSRRHGTATRLWEGTRLKVDESFDEVDLMFGQTATSNRASGFAGAVICTTDGR